VRAGPLAARQESRVSEIVIYTRQFCGYCSAARRLLEQKGIAFTEIDATGNPELRAEMTAKTGGWTFPQILINGRPVGGCDELYGLERAGRLDAMLAEQA